MKRVLIGLALVVCLSGCKSVPYPQDRDTFLRTNDPHWSIWLDTVIYQNLNGTQMTDFKRTKGLGFGRTPLLLLGSSPRLEPIIIQGYGCTIREFLWNIHRKYGFVIDLHSYKGKVHLRVRSPEVVRLTLPK
jgi:hypothetical protein